MRTNHILVLGAALLAAGCAAPAYVSPVEVTRFVGDPRNTLGQGTIAIDPAPGMDAFSLEFGVYRDAVARELTTLGYRVVAQSDPRGGAQVAVLSLEQSVEAPADRRGPVSVGGGASTGSFGSGVGLGLGIDLSGRPSERIATRVSLAIRPAGGGANLWEGRASMTATANSDAADSQVAATRIADGLFEGFPGMSGETILVR